MLGRVALDGRSRWCRMRVALIATVCVCAAAAGARAQSAPEATAEAATDEAPEAARTLRKSPVEVMYMKNEQGKLVPVPLGITLEDLEDLLKEKLNPKTDGPKVRVSSVAVSGNADDRRADLDVELQVNIESSRLEKIPVRFGDAVLLEHKHQGSGIHYVTFEEGIGFVSWIRAAEESGTSQHVIRLKLRLPVQKIGNLRRISLQLPRATSMKLKSLNVRSRRAVVSVSDPASFIVNDPKHQGNNTIVSGDGRGGDLLLSWREGNSKPAKLRTVVGSSASLLVTIDKQDRIITVANLQVRARTGKFQTLHVRLPRGASLVSGNQPGYEVDIQDQDVKEQGKDDRQVVEVRFESPQSAADVYLRTEQALAGETSDRDLDLAGFSLIGPDVVGSQAGVVAVAIEGDTYARQVGGERILRTSQLPESLRRENVIAGYRFFGGDWSLRVGLTQKKQLVRLEPTYIVTVEPDHLRLEARLRYQVTGGKVDLLSLDLTGWTVERVVPKNSEKVAVNQSLLQLDQVSPLVLPLVEAASGTTELTVFAQRSLEEEKTSVTVPLPLAREAEGGGLLVVQPANNVELESPQGNVAGLTPELGPPDVTLPTYQQPPTFYRIRTGGQRSSVEFTWAVRERRIAIEVENFITFAPDGYRVRQKMACQIEHQRLDAFTLVAGDGYLSQDELVMLVDGEEVEPRPLTEADAGSPHFTLRPADPKIGRCEVELRYFAPLPAGAGQIVLPLAVPAATADVRIEPGRTTVLHTDSMKISPQPPSDSRVERFRRTQEGQAGAVMSGGPPLRQLNLDVELPQAVMPDESISIELAWLQTWLSRNAMRARAVYAVTTDRKQLQIKLPAEADDAHVRVDGQDVAVQGEGQTLRVPLPPGLDRRFALEVWYQAADGRSSRGTQRFGMPEIDGVDWIRQFYWQLVTPPEEYLWSQPADLQSEMVWRWRGLWPSRTPRLSQRDLERRLRVDSLGEVPPSANSFVFSSFGAPTTMEIVTISRSFQWLLVAGAALLAGYLLMYVPALRSLRAVIPAAILVVLLGVSYPEPVVLLLGVVGFGVLLVIIAFLLQRIVQRPRGVSTQREAGTTEPSTTQFGGGRQAARVAISVESTPAPLASASSRTQAG